MEDIQELLVNVIVRRAGAVLLPLEGALLLFELPDVHGLDVEVVRPVLTGATAGGVGEGGAAGAREGGGRHVPSSAGGAQTVGPSISWP